MAETSRDPDFTGEFAAVEILDEKTPTSPKGVPAELVQMAAFMRQKQAGSLVGPPHDPNFFQTFRLSLSGDALTSPFTQHPWVFAGINRIATDASSVPFVVMTEAPEGVLDGEMVVQSKDDPGTPAARKRNDKERRQKAHEARRPHFEKLRNAVPRIPEWFHDHYEQTSPRKYFQAVRSRAPDAPIGLVCKATGVVVVEEGPWVELFDTPNRHMTRSQLWESTCIYLGEGGECFWILDGKSGEKQPTEIPSELLPTGRGGWEPVLDKETRQLIRWKRRARFGGISKEDKFELHEVIQFRYFNPEDPLRGLAPIRPAELEIKQDHRASLFNNAFFVHGAQLGGVLTSDKQLNPRQVKEIREQFEARHGGVTKAFKTAVLEGGVKFTETGVRQRDMQFIQLRKMSRDIILAVLGVPKSEVGVIEDVNRATATVSKRTMWENTIIPKLTYIEDLLWSQLFRPTTGDTFWGLFDFSQVEALRDDLMVKTEVFAKLVDKGYPVNVVAPRLEMGLPAVPWGNVWWSPNNLVPVSGDPTELPPPPQDEGPDEPPDEPPPEDDEAIQAKLDAKLEALEGDDEGEDPDEIFSDIEGLLEDGTIDASLYDEVDEIISRTYDNLPDDWEEKNEKRWQRWDEIERQLMTPGERKIRDAVAKNLFQIRRRQMKLFNQVELGEDEPFANAVTEADQILFVPKEFREKLRDRVEPIYGKLFDDAFEDAEKELDELGFPEDGERTTDSDLVPNILPLGGVSEVRATLLAHQQRRIMATVDTVRNQLRTVLRTAISEGLTKAQTRTRLKQAFGRLRSKPRIIGSTESASLVNGGRHTSFAKRRIPNVEWLSARDELVRREHIVFNAAGPRPLGHNWAKELGLGAVFTIRRPLDPSAPARLVINCRCTLIPSVAQQLTDDQILRIPPEEYERFETLEFGSEAAFRDKKGKWKRKRQALHDAIVRKHFEGVTRVKEPEVHMLGGGPSSGKSSVTKKMRPTPPNFVKVDVDEIRTMLPEWRRGAEAKNAMWNHSEASSIAKRIAEEGAAVPGSGGYNLLIDGTGDSSFSKLEGKILGYRSRGATRVSGIYVTLDTDTAFLRMLERGKRSGRFVPETYMRQTHASVSEVVPKAIDKGLFDDFELYDNKVPKGADPVLVARASGTNLEVLDEERWARFLAKAKE